MGIQAGGMGNRNKAMLTFTSPCASPWLLLGPEPSSPISSQLYFTDEITSWLKGTECWKISNHFPVPPGEFSGRWVISRQIRVTSLMEGKEGSG